MFCYTVVLLPSGGSSYYSELNSCSNHSHDRTIVSLIVFFTYHHKSFDQQTACKGYWGPLIGTHLVSAGCSSAHLRWQWPQECCVQPQQQSTRPPYRHSPLDDPICVGHLTGDKKLGQHYTESLPKDTKECNFRELAVHENTKCNLLCWLLYCYCENHC